MSADRSEILGELSIAVRRSQRASEAVDAAAQTVLGINRSDGRCLDALEQHGRMTEGELARATEMTAGGLAAVLDRLESEGYVNRTTDERDQRTVFVGLTDRAREISWELFGPLAEETGPLLERYTDEQLRLLAEFHVIIAEMQERHAQQLRERGQGATP